MLLFFVIVFSHAHNRTHTKRFHLNYMKRSNIFFQDRVFDHRVTQRIVTIHWHWSAQEGCSVTGWWPVGGMFTLPSGKEEAPWGVSVVGPGYKLAEYLKRLNHQCFVNPTSVFPSHQPKVAKWVGCNDVWVQVLEQWQIWAHSCRVHWKKAGVGGSMEN